VAYGTRIITNLTSSISTISSNDLAKAPVSTLGNAIQGLGTGFTVLRSMLAQNRVGTNQISTSAECNRLAMAFSPLVIVDNVERDFTQLDPEEIESLTLLKDAAATAMYGMRGANGVILVNTKKGLWENPSFR
jgi:TonB-dependent SusC/RagA subfamily outer membrane receptor